METILALLRRRRMVLVHSQEWLPLIRLFRWRSKIWGTRGPRELWVMKVCCLTFMKYMLVELGKWPMMTVCMDLDLDLELTVYLLGTLLNTRKP